MKAQHFQFLLSGSLRWIVLGTQIKASGIWVLTVIPEIFEILTIQFGMFFFLSSKYRTLNISNSNQFL